MSQAALQQIASGLAGAQAAQLAGELVSMHAHLVRTLDALAQVTRDGFIPRQERQAASWDEARATQLVLDLLVQLKAAHCHVFPYGGTLLGLEREGHLLRNDKDADLGVWLEDFTLAARVLQRIGLRRATDMPPFGNLATYVDPGTGCTVELCGLRRDPTQMRIEGGAWLYGKPPSHQRVLLLPWFELAVRSTAAGEVWWPDKADRLLTACYGDWQTPDPEWNSLVSNFALQGVNLHWHAFALKNLAHAWLAGDLARTARLLERVIRRGGDDEKLASWKAALALEAPLQS